MVYDFDTPLNRRGTNSMKWDELSHVFGRDDLMPFWVADMDFRSAPEIIDSLRARVEFGVFGYPWMTNSAREAVAEWEWKRHGWKIDPSDVEFTPGVVTALAMGVNAFTEPGDGVMIQTPVYPPFFRVIEDNGRRIVENPLKDAGDRYEMDFDALRRSLTDDVKAMILCSPHNPVARVWSREELTQLAEICLERNIIILNDEIHQDLVYSDAKHIPLSLAVPEADRILVTFVAPSKTFNIAGLCGSAVIARDRKMREKMGKALGSLHIQNINMLAIDALETAYRKGGAWLDALIAYLEGNRGLVEAFLRDRMPRVKLKHPEGTFIFWLDFRDYGLPNSEIQRILVESAGVALNPGPNFGASGEGFARLNIGCPKKQLEEGLARIETAFGRV